MSYWQCRAAGIPEPCPLLADVETDVLIVGAGITGALLSEALSQRCRTIVVDRRGAGLGSTLASTALVEHEIDTPLIHLAQQIGEKAAMRAWRRSRDAVRRLAERTRVLGIECDARSVDSLYLCGGTLDADAMEDEASARREAGLDVTLLSREQLRDRFGIAREAALLTYDNMEVDPFRMATGYLQAARSHGASFHAPVDVVDIDSSAAGVLAGTRDGPLVKARSAVFATGYELPAFLPPAGHKIASTYAIATPQQPERLWPGRTLVWEASDPYLYLRTTPDGRVLCGGEDEDFSDEDARDALIPSKARTIAGKLKNLFPDLDTTPALAWAGAFGTTETGLPLIAEIPGMTGCWVALGFGGNGMTYAQVAAEIISAAADGRSDPDGQVYGFPLRSRLPRFHRNT